MKYFERLSAVEENIIKLDVLESILRVVAYDEGQTNKEDMSKIVFHVSDELEKINKALSEEFYELWNEIRNDTHIDENKYVPPSKASNELNEVISNWVSETLKNQSKQ